MFLIFPNQLFEDSFKAIKEHPAKAVYILEEPLFFYDEKLRPVRPNQIKLAYMVACMRTYFHYIQSKIQKPVHYIQYHEMKVFYDKVRTSDSIAFFDPIDKDVIERYAKLCPNCKVYESPNFILGMPELHAFFQDHPKQTRHATFYKYVKSKVNVLVDEPSYDTENRKSLPKGFQPCTDIPSYISKTTHSTYEEAKKYILTHTLFQTFPGTPEHVTMYPITFADSKKVLHIFLRDKLRLYGDYQDAIHPDDPFLYHAIISPMLNNGLLNPKYVLGEALQWKDKVAMNNLEGFLRQLIGWREYMRYLYVFHYEDMIASNHFQHTNTIKNWDAWYNGTTGIAPLDNEIKKASVFGYSHHIVRLMVFMNVFLLLEVHPSIIYKWFMEVVSIDAYDWVMRSNIYAMGWFYSAAMSKPYISSSNYILKMSKYKKGDWCKVWDSLFYRYIVTHQKDFIGSSKMYLQNLRAFARKSKTMQEEMMKTANVFLQNATKRL